VPSVEVDFYKVTVLKSGNLVESSLFQEARAIVGPVRGTEGLRLVMTLGAEVVGQFNQ
jgi:hypothetical protein